MRKALPVLVAMMLLGLVLGCQKRELEPSPFSIGLLRLADNLTGAFNSAAQAEADSNFHDIRLFMARFNRTDDDAIWLYVEQAASWSLDKPYRQRVYKLKEVNDSTFMSVVYAFPDSPLVFAGAWRDTARLAHIPVDSLVLREGCAIRLERTGDARFEGGTVGRGCGSDLYGAKFATSDVVVTPDTMKSWDRGWANDSTQAWGSEHGPYVFIKQRNFSL